MLVSSQVTKEITSWITEPKMTKVSSRVTAELYYPSALEMYEAIVRSDWSSVFIIYGHHCVVTD